MNAIQIFATLSSLAICLYWCWLIRRASLGTPESTWGYPGNPMRYPRNVFIAHGIAAVIVQIVIGASAYVIFAR